MISLLFSILIALLIFGLLWWAITAVIAVLPIPQPAKGVIQAVLVVILCLVLAYWLIGILPTPIRLPMR